MNCEQVLFEEEEKEVKYNGEECKLKKNTTTGETAEINGDNSICESDKEDNGKKYVKCYKGNKSLQWEVNDNPTTFIKACNCTKNVLGGAKKRKKSKKQRKSRKKSKKQRKSRKKH